MWLHLYEVFVNFLPYTLAWYQAGGMAINNQDVSNYALGWALDRYDK